MQLYEKNIMFYLKLKFSPELVELIKRLSATDVNQKYQTGTK